LPDRIVSSLKKDRDYLTQVLDRSGFYDSIEPQFNHLSALYVLHVLKQLAPGFESLTGFTAESLMEQLKLLRAGRKNISIRVINFGLWMPC